MTEQGSLSVVDREPAPPAETQVTVEQLEFGKFCVSTDGPIESNSENIPIEHSQLGWSKGFPEELIPVCYPTRMSVVLEDGEVLPRPDAAGTVLRLVVCGNSKKARTVLYSIKARAEAGEGRSGRRYTLARYLTAPDGRADPLTMLAAMNSTPLAGITRATARSIAAITLDHEDGRLDDTGEAFLREALIFILSGIAISITEEIPPEEFFTWVAAVHDRLPPALRPHLSAGWNVGSSYSGKLAITYTTHHATNTALFSRSSHTWSPPKYVTTWNAQRQPVVNRFFEARLEPGRMFERYVSAENESDRSVAREQKLSQLVASLSLADLPELPGWDDPVTVRIFRYPGLQARDQFALKALERWLTTAGDSDVCLDIRKLSYQSNRLRALELILETLSEPSSRSRADQALWSSISGKIPASIKNALNEATGAGAKRARLMAAVAEGDVFNTLSALQAVAPDESEDLPDEVLRRLRELLDRSLSSPTDAALSYHAELLTAASRAYREWAAQRALWLMSVLGPREEPTSAALAAISNIGDSDAIQAFYSFLTNETLTPPVEDVFKQLPPEERSVFTDLFNHRWRQEDEDTAIRRENLLAWFHMLRSNRGDHPLLRLVCGNELTEQDVFAIARDVELGYVPQSLWPQVAELSLQNWSLLKRQIMSHDRRWAPLVRLWPGRYARVLGNNAGTSSPTAEIARTAQGLRLGFDDLQYLLDRWWFPTASFKQVAPLLWDWAMQLPPRAGVTLTAFDLCRHFLEARLPDTELSDTEFESFVKLISYSGQVTLPRNSIQRMWLFASRSWQIKLLMTLFPQEDLVPTAAQLSVLLRQREWLQEHLRHPHVHFTRSNLFRIATEPFHGLSYRGSSYWRDEFLEHPIWAAFHGVPVSGLRPRSLRLALRAYTNSDDGPHTGEQPDEVIEKQARLCLKFLEAYKRPEDQDQAVRVVLLQFLLRLLQYRFNKEGVQATFAAAGSELELPGYRRPENYANQFGPTVRELIGKIVLLTDHRYLADVIKASYKRAR